ncbi:hypothetical protein ABEB36_002185 [Hypothenemus hampei]|uniref:Uncharacterized protein n=1 Tax=Hypothenemus hampei TaxID=57062 RepID=A0ABD1F4V5_HYPHA
MEIFTIEEKVFMVFQFAAGQSLEQCSNSKSGRSKFPNVWMRFTLHHKPLPQNNNEREEQEIMICVSVEENPDQSIKEIAEQFDLPRRREAVVFCETAMERANNDENFIKNILLRMNRLFHYWVMLIQPSLDTGDHVIGPFFIDGNLNGRKYLDLLQAQVIPAIQQLGVELGDVWFQQDGCPAH